MPKHFALVFLAEENNKGKFVDVGDDPCFLTPPSWGICRPDIRNEKGLLPGSNLLFIARIKKDRIAKYYLKGYFSVEEKIDVVTAYNRYRGRKNVIISTKPGMPSNLDWANERWKKACFEKYSAAPQFVQEMKHDTGVYFQADHDNHHIDNWKCRRIYNCTFKSFEKCLAVNSCRKQSEELKKNYIVGNEHDCAEWDDLKVEWSTVASMINKPKELMVGNRHPEVELSIEEFGIVKEYMMSAPTNFKFR